MARSEEKAQGMWNRWLQIKTENVTNYSNNFQKNTNDTGSEYAPRGGRQGGGRRRPRMARECQDLNDADVFRQEILKEVGSRVGEIQNAALPEDRVRDLNDEINKLIREKEHWEKRIVELGGPDYSATTTTTTKKKNTDTKTSIRSGAHGGERSGYKYFGMAKKLPGVEDFERAGQELQRQRLRRRTRAELLRGIDARYYGLRDEEDGVMLEAERQAEMRIRETLRRTTDDDDDDDDNVHGDHDALVTDGEVTRRERNPRRGEKEEEEEAEEEEEEDVDAAVHKGEMDAAAMLLEKKKRDLQARYASADLLRSEKDAKTMLRVGDAAAVEATKKKRKL